MKLKNIIFLILGLYLFNFSLAFAADERLLDKDEYREKIITLDWKFSEQENGEVVQINNTNASVILVKDEAIIQGWKNVNQYTWWSFGQPAEDDDIAIIRSLGDYSYSFYLAYNDDGYVSLDDWKELDPKSLINQLRETAKKNAEYYKSQNLEYVKSIDWIFQPSLNEKFKTVSYSYKVVWSDNKITMEAKNLTLGKKGYISSVYVIPYSENLNLEKEASYAKQFANTVKFNEGYRHADYKSGDKVAAMGIGGLVAGSLGVKALAKAGVLAKFLKFGWILLAPLLLFLGKLSGGGKTEQSSKRKKKTK